VGEAVSNRNLLGDPARGEPLSRPICATPGGRAQNITGAYETLLDAGGSVGDNLSRGVFLLHLEIAAARFLLPNACRGDGVVPVARIRGAEGKAVVKEE